MGNHVSSSSSSSTTGKVILSNGELYEFNKSLTVAELMLEYQQQVVVELVKSTVSLEKKPIPLPADKQLEIGKYYLMLPLKRGKPISLSSEESRHILTKANMMLRSRSTKFLLPLLFARICPLTLETGLTENDHPKLFTKKERHGNVVKIEDKGGEDREKGINCFDAFEERLLEGGLRPEYLSRQVSGREWKPNLDTIVEKKFETKMSRWVILTKKLKATV